MSPTTPPLRKASAITALHRIYNVALTSAPEGSELSGYLRANLDEVLNALTLTAAAPTPAQPPSASPRTTADQVQQSGGAGVESYDLHGDEWLPLVIAADLERIDRLAIPHFDAGHAKSLLREAIRAHRNETTTVHARRLIARARVLMDRGAKAC